MRGQTRPAGTITVVPGSGEAVADTAELRHAFSVAVPIMSAAGKALGAGVYRRVFAASSSADRDVWLLALSKCAQPLFVPVCSSP
jgi:hypothetical protein